jgi:hypothetical protein
MILSTALRYFFSLLVIGLLTSETDLALCLVVKIMNDIKIVVLDVALNGLYLRRRNPKLKLGGNAES